MNAESFFRYILDGKDILENLNNETIIILGVSSFIAVMWLFCDFNNLEDQSPINKVEIESLKYKIGQLSSVFSDLHKEIQEKFIKMNNSNDYVLQLNNINSTSLKKLSERVTQIEEACFEIEEE